MYFKNKCLKICSKYKKIVKCIIEIQQQQLKSNSEKSKR